MEFVLSSYHQDGASARDHAVIVIGMDADFPSPVTVIVTGPSLLPFTVPFLFTVAVAFLLDLNVREELELKPSTKILAEEPTGSATGGTT